MSHSQPWTRRPSHRLWLLSQAEALFAFFERHSVNPAGGFHALDRAGLPVPGAGPEIHATARMVHSFVMAQLLGRPGATRLIDHGMDFLWNGHRDTGQGGYFWGTGRDSVVGDSKQAYGHAFVLLAGSSAKMIGHPDADRLIADVSQVLEDRFWQDDSGTTAEEFTRDWQPISGYRGANSNMHLAEALMAAFEATGDRLYLTRAERIAAFFLNGQARRNGWRLPEHYTEAWVADPDYVGNPMFRPQGTTPGHSLEWARLLVQMWELGQRQQGWMLEAAQAVYLQATADGWDKTTGGFYYTVGDDGAPRVADRYWWPCCEGIAAAAVLADVTGKPVFEDWYRRIWDFTATRFLDRDAGGWHPQLGPDLVPNADPFFGKPDIYHAIQALLIPLVAPSGSVIAGLKSGVSLAG